MKLVKIEKDPNIIVNKSVLPLLDPDFVYIPIKDDTIHVSTNDQVLKHDLITGKNTKHYSSISGKVLGIEDITINDKTNSFIVIENDFREKSKSIKKNKNNMPTLNFEEIIKASQNLSPLIDFKESYDNLVISTIHDEPYVFNHIISLKENIDDILELIDKLGELLSCHIKTLVVKNNESEIIDDCLNTIGTYPSIGISLVEDEYLLGQKEFLLPKLGLDPKKTLHLNITEILSVITLIKYKEERTTRIITISGNALKEGKIFRIKKGIKLKEILDKYIEITTKNYQIIANNLLNGFLCDENIVLTDDVISIHIMKKENIRASKCIKCGKCLSICPRGIDIVYCLNNKKKNSKCISCGLCSYICPSRIPLEKYIRRQD